MKLITISLLLICSLPMIAQTRNYKTETTTINPNFFILPPPPDTFPTIKNYTLDFCANNWAGNGDSPDDGPSQAWTWGQDHCEEINDIHSSVVSCLSVGIPANTKYDTPAETCFYTVTTMSPLSSPAEGIPGESYPICDPDSGLC
jgi:hypothetical protein